MRYGDDFALMTKTNREPTSGILMQQRSISFIYTKNVLLTPQALLRTRFRRSTYFLGALSLKLRIPEKRETHYLVSVTCDLFHIFYSSQKAMKRVMRLSIKVRPIVLVSGVSRRDYIVYCNSWHKLANTI